MENKPSILTDRYEVQELQSPKAGNDDTNSGLGRDFDLNTQTLEVETKPPVVVVTASTETTKPEEYPGWSISDIGNMDPMQLASMGKRLDEEEEEDYDEGIVASSISYYVQGIVMKKRGPVFATAFSPLMMVIVAIMGSFVLAEKIFLGGVIGAVLIVIGLYAVLWGKQKENEVTHCEMLEPTKNIDKVTEDVEANNGTEMKHSDSMLSTIVISAPASETTLKKTSQEP
ncbi:hypothetical protein F2Q68_00023118 [Brassica cretica]|uniref:WAT1-related protein n=1 Tax=Brassica cretica TaxID=69181 RepID=A0A8S9FUZ5_BRACR|nr:hypothetical protein F2Q68_00023118 [Brassica cretica]